LSKLNGLDLLRITVNGWCAKGSNNITRTGRQVTKNVLQFSLSLLILLLLLLLSCTLFCFLCASCCKRCCLLILGKLFKTKLATLFV